MSGIPIDGDQKVMVLPQSVVYRGIGVMEYWSIVECPVSDGGIKGTYNCSAGGQEKLQPPAEVIHLI